MVNWIGLGLKSPVLVSYLPTVLSRPRVINIRKNKTDQNEEQLSVDMASGYTTNTSPGPPENDNIKNNRNCYLGKILCYIIAHY